AQDATVWRDHEALSPEFDAAVTGRVRLETDPVDGNDEAAIGDGMRTLHCLPRLVLLLADFLLFFRVPADRGGIEEDLRALHRSEACRFRVPLVPADQHAELGSFRTETLEAEVAGGEIVLLVIARIVRYVHLAVLADIPV